MVNGLTDTSAWQSGSDSVSGNKSIGHMKKVKSIILCSAVIALAGCAAGPTENDSEKPEIVEVFACSDYCPGPEEKYLKRVYAGVTEKEECLALGGRPYSYIGWGRFTVCIAE